MPTQRSLSIASHATALGSFPSGVWIAGEVFTVEGAFVILVQRAFRGMWVPSLASISQTL